MRDIRGCASRGRRATGRVCAATASAVVLALPGAASATVDVAPSNDGTTLTITARAQSGSDGNHGLLIETTLGEVTVRQKRFLDPAIETTGTVCSRNAFANSVSCRVSPATVVLDLGDGSDDVEVAQFGGTPLPGAGVPGICVTGDRQAVDRPALAIRAGLGAGGDRFRVARPAGVTDVSCPSASRAVTPRLGPITVDGEEGSDTFFGAPELDGLPPGVTWSGGTGADIFNAGVGIETFSGGPNRDTVSYSDVRTPINVSVGNTAFGDGPDGDDVRSDVEVVTAGAAGDDIRGTAGRNEFFGGPGGDRYLAGDGDDLIVDVDGVPDRVDCGAGLDEARIDLTDVVVAARVILLGRLVAGPPSCEAITRFAVDDGPPAAILGTALRLAAPAVRLACPRAARIPCRGELVLRDPRRPARVLARARYAIPLGARRRVPLDLSRAHRNLLRDRGGVVVATSERGVSSKGPRGERRLLSVR